MPGSRLGVILESAKIEGQRGVEMTAASTTKKIAPGAYSALTEALAVIYWNKIPFESFVRNVLREHPELLAPLNFGEKKREVAARLVDLLADAEDLIAKATNAVAELRTWTAKHQELVTERARHEEERAKIAAKAATSRALASKLEELRAEFFELHTASNPQQRGRDFEVLLNDLFILFDLLPRRSFVLQGEQIDGSFTHATDNYIVEARWRKDPAENSDLAVFAEKVRRKGKNALGLFVSVNGFTSGALNAYSTSTPFVIMDGGHLLAVLEQRIPLDDLLDRMKRNMDETGHCLLPIARALSEG
jgi:hypothetical protein